MLGSIPQRLDKFGEIAKTNSLGRGEVPASTPEETVVQEQVERRIEETYSS